jgi:hypothetical protein
MLRLFVPLITVNGDGVASVLDHAWKERVGEFVVVALASIRSDSLLPTPTLSPLLLVRVLFGKPPVVLTAPVQSLDAM